MKASEESAVLKMISGVFFGQGFYSHENMGFRNVILKEGLSLVRGFI